MIDIILGTFGQLLTPFLARKARKTYRFSKDWRFHEAVTYLTLYSYNFCWLVRTLTIKGEGGRRVRRSPAMAAGLTDHVWSMRE